MSDLRSLPSVERLMQTPQAAEFIANFGRMQTLETVRSVLEEIRRDAKPGNPIPGLDSILATVSSWLYATNKPTLLPVINATGVILHTNLGRAPLSLAAAFALQRIAMSYSSQEFDLENGKRGSRDVHVETLLTRLTGAEAAMVVNNNAAAVLLALTTFAKRRSVVISRSQLVEIGGGFRVPEIMRQSGARLIEVGTTNRVHLTDYTGAMDEQNPALVMHAHSSNFRLIGFTSEPELKDVVEAAHARGLPFLDDLGSGALLDTAEFGLAHEPMVQESLAAGSDLVCFSGDKLLGGPQAGIILGKKTLIQKLKKHPLARAVRVDKFCLAALAETIQHYLKGEALRAVPVWQMISATTDQVHTRAHNWQKSLGVGTLMAGKSTVGGGSLPEETLPTTLLAIGGCHLNQLMARLRCLNPPVIARVEADCVVFDPRTVLPNQDDLLVSCIEEVLRA